MGVSSNASARPGGGMSGLRVIATVRKNNLEEVRVSVSVGDRYPLVDMRVFQAPSHGGGEPVATRAGICVPRDKLPALIEALQAAAREASR